MRSVVVVLPASMWAMMPMLRYLARSTVRPVASLTLTASLMRATVFGLVRADGATRAEAAVAALRARGTHVVALETVPAAPYAHEYTFPCGPAGCALVLGNERHGLPPALLAACDGVVRLPCRGVKNSLNVGVALGMCGHEILRQWLSTGAVEG